MPELNEPLIREDERRHIALQCDTLISFLRSASVTGEAKVMTDAQIRAYEVLRDQLLGKRRRRA